MKFTIQLIVCLFACFLSKNSPVSAQTTFYDVCVEKPFVAAGAGFLKKIGFETSETLDGTGLFEPLDPAKISPAAGCHKLAIPLPKMAVRPTKTDTPWNGLSTWDLVTISKHINGIKPFTSCLQYFVADINGNSQVTTFDIVQLRKIILGDLILPKSWLFVVQDSSLLQPPGVVFDCSTQKSGVLTPNKPAPGFWGLKIGDLNFDYPVDSLFEVENRSRPTLSLLAADLELQLGDSQIIQFFPEKTGDWLGWQAAFLFDETAVEIEEILPETPDGSAAPSAVRTAPGRLAMNWFSGEPTTFSPGSEPFISLKINALRKNRLSEAIRLEAENLPAEAYSADETAFKIELQFLKIEPQKEVAGLSVFPNPFSETVFLKLENEPIGECFFQVFDQAGRPVFSKKMDAAATEISGENLGASGAYFFRIADSQAVKTGSFFYQK